MILQELARRYAVGVCAMVAAGDTEGAHQATCEYMREAMERGFTPYEAMYRIFQSTVGCAVAASDHAPEGGEAFFRDAALGLAVMS